MNKRWVILGAAAALLVVGYLFGASLNIMDDAAIAGIYRQILPELHSFEPLTQSSARALNAEGETIAYIGFSEQVGWGGNLLVGTIVEPETGTLRQPVLIENHETPSFLARVTSRLGMYQGLPATSVITPGQDIDTVTGATITNIAIANAVRETAHSIASGPLGLSPQPPPVEWYLGVAEIAAIAVFAAGFFVSQSSKLRKYRMTLLCINIFVLGFWLNRALSVVQFSNLFLGIFPSPMTNPLFYIVLIGALAPIFLLGKNLYCTYICPFCGLLEVTNKFGRNKSLGKSRKWLARLRYSLLFLLLLGAMVSANANFLNFEPFGSTFGLDLNISPILWIPVAFSIITGLFFRRLWCVALCPAGAMLDTIRDAVVDIRSRIKGRQCGTNKKTPHTGKDSI